MKTIAVLMALAFSLNVFAGGEEHEQAQACYSVVVEESSQINKNIPTQICLERVLVKTTENTFAVYSFFYSDLYENINLTYVARKNEDFYSFRSQSLIRDDIDSDMNSQKITLFISGVVDNYGDADIKFLTISLEQIVGKTFVETPYVKNTYKYKYNR